MIHSCLTLSNIRYVSRIKWSNPGKGVAPSPKPRCSNYWKGSVLGALDYGHQLYYIYICVCVCVPVCVRVYVFTSVCVCVFLCIDLSMILICIYIYICTHTHIYIYIYIYTERERERDREGERESEREREIDRLLNMNELRSQLVNFSQTQFVHIYLSINLSMKKIEQQKSNMILENLL